MREWRRYIPLIAMFLVIIFLPTFMLQGKVLETNFLLLLLIVCSINVSQIFTATIKVPGIRELSLEEGYGKQLVNCMTRIGFNCRSLRFYITENRLFNNMQVRGSKDIVLLADRKLLKLLEDKEREGLFLHELCHVVKKDQLKRSMLWAGYTAFVVNMLFFCRRYDEEILWVAFSVLIFSGLFLVVFVQKRIELRADLFAISNGCERNIYIAMLKKIVPQEEGISFSHPSLKKRIDYILKHAKIIMLERK